jgi:hypothetical protein
MSRLEILNPVAFVTIRKSNLAPRLKSLEGKRIALYWNSKPGGDVALARTSDTLGKKFPTIQFEVVKGATPAPKQRVDHLKTFDGVIASTAD